MAALPCPHRPPCPGCPRFGVIGLAEETFDRLVAWTNARGLPAPDVAVGAPFGFRQRARLMVRGRSRSPKVGLFQTGSHRIVDVPHCPIHTPLINRVAREIRHAVRTCAIDPYADKPHRGLLRAVQIVVERASDRAQVTLVANDSAPESLRSLADQLVTGLGDRLQGLWWNGNPERTNAILGPHWHHWHGEECAVESMAGVQIFSPPGAFGQSHPQIAERIALAVAEQVPTGSRVAELYAGSGALSLSLLEHVARLHLNEINPHGLRGLELGLAQLSPAWRARAQIWPGPADAALGVLEEVDCVIVDPPRRGLDPKVREALAASRLARLIYVSCGLDSLIRDSSTLEAAGWRATHVEAFDAFPYTVHAETLAVFERAPRDAHA